MTDYAWFWRSAREARGLSQAETALRLGVPKAVVSAVERGARRYTFEQTTRLMKVLDQDPTLIVLMLLADDERAILKAFKLDKKPED